MANPTASVKTQIDIPVEAAWSLLRDYGNWEKWWPYYLSMDIIGDGKDEIGAIRKFKTLEGTVYEERLIERDDVCHVLTYAFVSVTPPNPAVVSISTTVRLTKDETTGRTNVDWSSWMQANLPEEILKKITHKQEDAYRDGIRSIVQHFVGEKVIKEAFSFLNEKVLLITKALLMGQTPTWGYEEYPPEFGPLPKMVRGLPASEALPPNKLGDMTGRFLELAYLTAGKAIQDKLQDNHSDKIDYKAAALGLVNYGKGLMKDNKSLVDLTNYLATHWEDDAEFCQQLLTGVNPLHIRVVKSLHEVPKDMLGLKGQGHTVEQLIAENRLFILDYKELVGLKEKNVEPHMYFKAPIMLVYKQLKDEHHDGHAHHASRLNILGIQLDRAESGNVIYTPDMPQKNRFKLAKMYVACADNQVHEFRYHLGLSHLGMEPIIISVHNCLPPGNPIRAILEPHLKETIGINFFARQTLVSNRDAFTDNTFAIGTAQGVKLASDGWKDYDFFGFSFPEQLKSRGFDEVKSDGLEHYYYREDGFLLWNAIGEYTWDVVTHFYPDDSHVKNDPIIQKWAAEASSKEGGAVPGFPAHIETRTLLSKVLQTIIWNGSALHSALNFPQWPYLGFVPNRPNAVYQPMPVENGEDITEEYLERALLPPFQTLFQVNFSWLLSMPSENSLFNLSAMKGIYDEADCKFKTRLTQVTDAIKARNQKLTEAGKVGYIFLLPENVANSVNI